MSLKKMKPAKITDLKVDRHVLFHSSEGIIHPAVVAEEAHRGNYSLRFRNGALGSAKREQLELDPTVYPASGVFLLHCFPMQFVVLPGPERSALVDAISRNGGEVVSIVQDKHTTTIHAGSDVQLREQLRYLADTVDGWSTPDKVYKMELIYESIRQNKILHKESYILSTALLPSPLPTTSISGGRRLFTVDEDSKMLDFLNSKRGVPTLGEKIWREAEKAQICPGRTWQSMKERFKKHLELQYNKQRCFPSTRDGSAKIRKKEEDDEKAAESGAREAGAGRSTLSAGARLAAEDSKRKRSRMCADAIDILVSRHKVPRTVAVHAGVVCSGDMMLADRYLSGLPAQGEGEGFTEASLRKTGGLKASDEESSQHSLHLWSYEEDQILIEEESAVRKCLACPTRSGTQIWPSADFADALPAELRELFRRRGPSPIRARVDWIHADSRASESEDADSE